MIYTDEELNLLQQKAKERTVKTQSIEYDLETLVKKIDNGYIKLDPDYQRRHRWNEGTSSRLIESLILNIPIPMIYLSLDVDIDKEVDDDIPRYTVIDGQQRLTAIVEFLNNRLTLCDLDVLVDLQGKKYNDLPSFLIRRLEDRTIGCLRIDSTVDEQVKYDIFERLNSGSIKLTPQELRNAIVRGPFNDLLKRLAKDENFRTLVNISDSRQGKVDKMEDVELVLRFFSIISNRYLSYKGGFKDFLTESMKDYSLYSNEEIEKLGIYFIKFMSVVRNKFGDNAFAKYKHENRTLKRISSFNVSVFDALIIGVDSLENIEDIQDKHVTKFNKLFKIEEFFDAITGSVNDVVKLRKRATMSIEVFKS